LHAYQHPTIDYPGETLSPHLGIKKATTPFVIVLKAIGIAPTNSDWLECLYRCFIVSVKKIARPNMRQLNSINRPTFKLQTASAIPCWPAATIEKQFQF
jgi:hypothetical protein